jgi:hypothetical protein
MAKQKTPCREFLSPLSEGKPWDISSGHILADLVRLTQRAAEPSPARVLDTAPGARWEEKPRLNRQEKVVPGKRGFGGDVNHANAQAARTRGASRGRPGGP